MIKVILCAYNESKNLKKLLVDLIYELKLINKPFEIIFCIDCSNDDSSSIIKEFQDHHPVKVIPQQNKRGLGIAFKRIFKYVLQENFNKDDIIISLDADNTHKPEQIIDMLKHFENNHLDVLIASRFHNKSSVINFPIYRTCISISVATLLNLIFAVKDINKKNIKDYTSGYRIYNSSKLEDLYNRLGDDFILEPEFTYTSELLIKLYKTGARIDEFPIVYDYKSKIGNSKINLLKNFFRLIILIINLKN